MPLAAAKYVSLTTFKRNGEGVATPVWIAPLEDGRLGFTTDAGTWKVKRIGNNPTVTLQPCNARGKVSGVPIEATAAVFSSGSELEQVTAAIRKKYGFQVTAIHGFQTLVQKILRRPEPAAQIAIVVDPAQR